MNRKIVLALLSSISIAALTQGCTVNTSDDLSGLFAKSDKGWLTLSDYDRGKHYVAVGDYGLAIEAFNAALGQDPKSVLAMNGLAIAYDRIGRKDVAQTFLAKALELDPHSPDTLNNLAYLHLSHGEKDVAAVYFARAKEALAVMPPSEMSTTLATVVDNNSALTAAQTGVPPATQPAANITAEGTAPTFSNLEASTMRLASSEPEPSSSGEQAPGPKRPGLIASVAPAVPMASDVVASEIWDLRINGAEPKLIPPSTSHNEPQLAAQEPVKTVVVAANSKYHEAEPTKTVAPLVLSQATAPLIDARPSSATLFESPAPTFSFQRHLIVRITNGAGRRHMAQRFRHYLDDLGVPVRRLGNAKPIRHQSTIYYSRGQERAADALAKMLPISVRTVGLTNNYGVVELMLAPDLVRFDQTLIGRRSS